MVKEPYTPTHEIAYCIGLIVGEGCFSGDKQCPSLTVTLHASDPQPLLDLRSVFGGVIYGPYVHNGRHHQNWLLRGWQLEEALPFFDLWLPPSRKREQYEAWREKWADYFDQIRDVPIGNRWVRFHGKQ